MDKIFATFKLELEEGESYTQRARARTAIDKSTRNTKPNNTSADTHTHKLK